ncbi:MAG: Gfo/Idh/MocA family oxidoreductase [Pyrinomonadaceae bacterium]
MSVVKWGLIGAGDIARKRIAPAMRDLSNCELVSVSRSRAELAEEFAKEFGASKWFGDWRELIADPEIDAVYIATPVFLHAEQTIAAAQAGKHILCEKPMALNVDECDWMLAACRANNVKLGIAYYRRFYPVIERIKEIIADGEIGKASVAQINSFEYFDPEPDHPRHWFVEKDKSGGGPMMDFGCHRLEIFTSLFGEVSRVSSLVSNAALGREVEDTATALMQFKGGTCSSVTVTHASSEPQDTLHIFGTLGSIHVPFLNSGEMTINIGGEVRKESHPPAANFHEPLIAEFAESILQDRQPAVVGEDGREVQSLIEEIYEKGSGGQG